MQHICRNKIPEKDGTLPGSCIGSGFSVLLASPIDVRDFDLCDV